MPRKLRTSLLGAPTPPVTGEVMAALNPRIFDNIGDDIPSDLPLVTGVSSDLETVDVLPGSNTELTVGPRGILPSVPRIAVLKELTTAPPTGEPRLGVAFAGCFPATPSTDETAVSCGVLIKVDPPTSDARAELNSVTGGVAEGVIELPDVIEGTGSVCDTRVVLVLQNVEALQGFQEFRHPVQVKHHLVL
ncbi:hypothetical protein HPB51_011184 [Rhipicephalus microplus]|uniref:Uncharacterized protein n=1 Tax=Rhipicephalus microplus TaxID=6941 RepID=A0A9J6F309_RHIMP|nr:hypothetical protein HPB51_011184 [Rhipicephalus microplus]